MWNFFRFIVYMSMLAFFANVEKRLDLIIELLSK